METLSFSSDSSVGKCHQITFTRLKGLKVVEDHRKVILELRSKVQAQNIHTICNQHEQSLDIQFLSLIKKCADSFREHQCPRRKLLRVITMEFYSKVKVCLPRTQLVPGEKLCPSCRVKVISGQLDNLTEHPEMSINETNVVDLAGPSNVAGPSIIPAAKSPLGAACNL